MKITDRIQHAWNAFNRTDKPEDPVYGYGQASSAPARRGNVHSGRTFAAAIFNRIAMDVAATEIQHVKINFKNDDIEPQQSGLNYCLNQEANVDQTGIAFMQDLVYSMFDEGVVAVVPVDTDLSPDETGSFKIESLRVGKITQWYPKHVRVLLYNEDVGREEEIVLTKSSVAIIENPLYSVINGRNTTMSRLLHKMSLLDNMDEQLVNGSFNMYIQLPYAVKTDLQKTQAEERIKRIENQLGKSRRGITYIDAAEKLTELKKPVSDTLQQDVMSLTEQVYNQLGLTANIFNGTASEAEYRAYYARTIDPIIDSIIAEFVRKFFTKTARTQGHTLEAYRDPFKLVAVEQLGTISDLTRRNSILTGNEVRVKLFRIKRSNDPRADELYNPNIADSRQDTHGSLTSPDESSPPIQNE